MYSQTDKSRLFIGNLSYDFEEESLRTKLFELFSKYGEVGPIQIPINRETGRIKGIAFVTMKSEDGAAQSLENLNGYELSLDEEDDQPRPLRIDFAKPKPDTRSDDRGGY